GGVGHRGHGTGPGVNRQFDEDAVVRTDVVARRDRDIDGRERGRRVTREVGIAADVLDEGDRAREPAVLQRLDLRAEGPVRQVPTRPTGAQGSPAAPRRCWLHARCPSGTEEKTAQYGRSPPAPGGPGLCDEVCRRAKSARRGHYPPTRQYTRTAR